MVKNKHSPRRRRSFRFRFPADNKKAGVQNNNEPRIGVVLTPRRDEELAQQQEGPATLGIPYV